MKFFQKPHWLVVLIILVISAALLYFRPHAPSVSFEDGKIVEGKVISITAEREIQKDDLAFIGVSKIQTLLVETSEEGDKKRVRVENNVASVREGERIFLQELENGSYVMVDFSRSRGIIWLTVFFIGLVLLVSGKKGFSALTGLVFSFAVILSFIVPGILKGQNPVFVSIAGAVLILLVTLYVSHGFNRKSLAALLGISVTLVMVGLLAQYAVSALHFTGFGSEDAAFLKQEVGDKINLVALILSGIIIAAIGVLDDIAITQASIVSELASANRSLSPWQLFRKSMAVGKDHISAVVNTLILAYTGAALPLVLLLSIGSGMPAGFVVSIEAVSEEIVRTLIASSGLVLAVPATTFISIFFLKRRA